MSWKTDACWLRRKLNGHITMVNGSEISQSLKIILFPCLEFYGMLLHSNLGPWCIYDLAKESNM